MKKILTLILAAGFISVAGYATAETTTDSKPEIIHLNPPEKNFFSKELFFRGIPIKSHEVVSNDALYAAYDRLTLLTGHLPGMVITNLNSNHVELHIIGRDQVTTDLPEWLHDKGKQLEEYHGLTRDQRTRGMGGRLTSCGEENLLKLDKDKYHGRDICLHEFSHAIRNYGMDPELRTKFNQQYTNSLAKSLWVNSYAGSNPDEYFAELTMWYFGTHGDLTMTGPKPENGTEGLKKYDPDAYQLFDDFYQGKLPVTSYLRRFRPHEDD